MSCPEIYCIYIGRQLRLDWAVLLSLVSLHVLGTHPCLVKYQYEQFGAGGLQTHQWYKVHGVPTLAVPKACCHQLSSSSCEALCPAFHFIVISLHIPTCICSCSPYPSLPQCHYPHYFARGYSRIADMAVQLDLSKVIPITMWDALHSSLHLHFIPHFIIITLKPYIREKVEHSRWVAEIDN